MNALIEAKKSRLVKPWLWRAVAHFSRLCGSRVG